MIELRFGLLTLIDFLILFKLEGRLHWVWRVVICLLVNVLVVECTRPLLGG